MSEDILRYGTLGFEGKDTTAFEPLYPLLIAFLRTLTSDNLFFILFSQILVGFVGFIFFYKLCLLLSRDEKTARWAAFLFSINPYYIGQSLAVIDLTLAITLLILYAAFYTQDQKLKGAVLCGIFAGLALLTRAVIFPAILLGIIGLLGKRRVFGAVIIATCVILTTLPWMIRNYRMNGSPFPTRSGLNLYRANCKFSSQLIPFYDQDVLNGYLIHVAREEKPDLIKSSWKQSLGRELDHFYFFKAADYMRSHPLDVLKLKLRNLLYVFCPRLTPFYPHSQRKQGNDYSKDQLAIEPGRKRGVGEEWAYLLFYGFLLPISFLGFFYRIKNLADDFILVSVILGVSFYCVVFYPYTRHRALMDFALMFYSACAIRRFVPGWGQAAK